MLQGMIWLDNYYIITSRDLLEKDMTELQKKQYEQLIQEKLDVVDERDQLVQQLEEDRLKYIIIGIMWSLVNGCVT